MHATLESSVPATTPHSTRLAPSHLLILAGLILFMLAQGRNFAWGPLDDSYITFQFARNLATGHGIAFTPDLRTEGYTNFLWMATLAGLGRLGCDIPTAATTLSQTCAAIVIILTWLLARRIAVERTWPPLLALAPSAIIASHPATAFWAGTGMEGPFLTLLTLLFILLGTSDQPRRTTLILTAVVGALMAMTRWESILLWPIVLGAHLADTQRPIRRRCLDVLTIGATMTVLFGTYFLCRLHYFGDPMPNTYYAKLAASLMQRLHRGTSYAFNFTIYWLLPIGVLTWLVESRRRLSNVMTLTLLVQTLTIVYVGGDHFPWHRFFLPVMPIAAILLAGIVAMIIRSIPDAPTRRIVGSALTIAIIMIVFGIATRSELLFAQGMNRTGHRWQAIATWAKTSLPQDACIAVGPVGTFAWFSGHPTFDLFGLTDREIAHHGEFFATEGPGHQRAGIAILLKRHPEIVLGHANWYATPPTEEQTIADAARISLTTLYRHPEFKRLYEFTTAPIGDKFVAFWQLRISPASQPSVQTPN